MKILEVKNNLVKVSYLPQDNMVISGFVIIEDSQYAYVAQTMSLKADSGINYAIVRLLFTFNAEGVVKNYNGTIPELNANVTSLSADELLDILPIETPLTIGKLAQQNFVLDIDLSALEKNLLICSDNRENSDIFVSNTITQLNKITSKSVAFDTNGSLYSENKLVLGRDFKLPLNYETINFIYEHDLSDVDPSSKAVIQEILFEVQEYSNTLIDKFIPFDSFLAVIEAQYNKLRIPELALLKARLITYRDQNVFAQDAKDVQSVRANLRANLSTVIDISDAEPKVQKLAMTVVLDEIVKSDLYIYNFVKLDNENSDKKLIKKFLAQDKIYTTIICPHNYKYIHELKELSQNYLMFAPQTIQHDFAAYNVFLNKLNPDECVIYGKSTQNIPLIIEMMSLEDLNAYIESVSYSSKKDNNADENINKDFTEEADTYEQETLAEDNIPADELDVELEASDLPSENIMLDEADTRTYESDSIEEEALPAIENEADIISENEIIEQVDNTDVNNELSENEESLDTQFTQIPEVVDEIVPEESQFVEQFSEVEQQNEQEQEQEIFQEQIIDLPAEEDFIQETETLEQENSSIEPDNMISEELRINDSVSELPEIQEEVTQDNLTEADLDYIGDANAQQDILPIIDESDNVGIADNNGYETSEIVEDFNNFTEENNEQPDEESAEIPETSLTEQEFANDIDDFNSSAQDAIPEEINDTTQVEAEDVIQEEIPIYPAEEQTPINGIESLFESGDRVRHPKYGEGVVEKMVKFGDKVLCSINFANGRRLLDPTISQIEKL